MGGIEQEIAALEPGAHACMAYVSAEERTIAIAAFLREGIRRGERVLYAAAPDSRDPVAAQLQEMGLPVNRLREQEALMLIGDEGLYRFGPDFDPRAQAGRLAAVIERARADGFNGFRGAADLPADLEQRVRPEAFLRYEAAAHEVLVSQRSLGLCAYDRRRVGAELLLGLLRTHPFAVLGGRLCGNPFCDPPAYTLGVVGDDRRVDWMINQILRTEQSSQYQRAVNEALLREATSLAAQRQRLAERSEDLTRALEARDLLLGMVARRLKRQLGRLDRKLDGLLHEHRLVGGARDAPDPQDGGREELDELGILAGQIEGIAAFAAMQVALKREPMDLADAARAAVEAFRSTRQRPPVEVGLTAPAKLPGTWDRRRATEVITALLAVASDHSWGTPLEVKLEQAGSIARLTLRFHALEMDAANGASGGSGHGHSLLGSSYDRLAMELWTTRELVRLMGGTLGISGRADGQVTFTVEFPRPDESDPNVRDLLH